MLTAIAECLNEATAGTRLAEALVAYEKSWRAHRDDRTIKWPGAFFEQSHKTDPRVKPTIKALNTVRAKLHHILDTKRRLKQFCGFMELEPSPQAASYAAREAMYDTARAQLPAWRDNDGYCPCTKYESCGRGCKNFLRGAQAAWCVRCFFVLFRL